MLPGSIKQAMRNAMTLELMIVPCLADNYAYILHEIETGTTSVIDVPEAAPILQVLTARGLKLRQILITHHHSDHIAGVEALAQATGAKVIGAAADAHRLPKLDMAVHPGQSFPLGVEQIVISLDGGQRRQHDQPGQCREDQNRDFCLEFQFIHHCGRSLCPIHGI